MEISTHPFFQIMLLMTASMGLFSGFVPGYNTSIVSVAPMVNVVHPHAVHILTKTTISIHRRKGGVFSQLTDTTP